MQFVFFMGIINSAHHGKEILQMADGVPNGRWRESGFDLKNTIDVLDGDSKGSPLRRDVGRIFNPQDRRFNLVVNNYVKMRHWLSALQAGGNDISRRDTIALWQKTRQPL